MTFVARGDSRAGKSLAAGSGRLCVERTPAGRRGGTTGIVAVLGWSQSPLSRFAQPPYFDIDHRWEWLPSRTGAAEEHPCDTSSAAELSEWIIARLPSPATPTCLLYHHPDEDERNHDLAAEVREGPEHTVWSLAPNWYRAWAEVDESPTAQRPLGETNVARHRSLSSPRRGVVHVAEQRRPAEESRNKPPARAALHTPTSRVSALSVSRTSMNSSSLHS